MLLECMYAPTPTWVSMHSCSFSFLFWPIFIVCCCWWCLLLLLLLLFLYVSSLVCFITIICSSIEASLFLLCIHSKRTFAHWKWALLHDLRLDPHNRLQSDGICWFFFLWVFSVFEKWRPNIYVESSLDKSTRLMRVRDICVLKLNHIKINNNKNSSNNTPWIQEWSEARVNQIGRSFSGVKKNAVAGKSSMATINWMRNSKHHSWWFVVSMWAEEHPSAMTILCCFMFRMLLSCSGCGCMRSMSCTCIVPKSIEFVRYSPNVCSNHFFGFCC